MTSRQSRTGDGPGSQPLLVQHGPLIQAIGTLRLLPIALSHEARLLSCQLLNQILADTMILYRLYKKHHWQMRGPTFEQLHLLLDKHAGEQLELIDALAGPSVSRCSAGWRSPTHATWPS